MYASSNTRIEDTSQAQIKEAIKGQNAWSDNCTEFDDITVSYSGIPESMVPGQSATVTVTLNDNHGSAPTTCGQTVNVVFDNQPDCPTLAPKKLDVVTGCALTKAEVISLLKAQSGISMEYCEDTKNGELLEDKLSSSAYAVQEKDAAESDYYVATWKFQLTSASAIECPQKFTVNDNVTPICSAEAISLAPTDATACSYEVTVVKPTITENCTVSKVEYALTDEYHGSLIASPLYDAMFAWVTVRTPVTGSIVPP